MKAKPVVAREQASRDVDEALTYDLAEGSPRYSHELKLSGMRCGR